MPTDLTVIVEDRPGMLASIGETLGNAGINIEGVCGFPCEGQGVIHVLVEDGASAASVLKDHGFDVREQREVIVLSVEDRPGELGRVARKIADAGVNVQVGYVATNNRLVFGVDDLEKARAALG
ncbi:MAG TPA: ACT domain-containing protein [Actinomycetota bacterium]|nr:ACT domain-containing protein [Actinomycetota bacterium]